MMVEGPAIVRRGKQSLKYPPVIFTYITVVVLFQVIINSKGGFMSMARFALGRIVATPGALEAFARNQEDFLVYISRHAMGDDGDLDEDDKKENLFSIEKGFRILSKYHLNDGTPIYIITEADRSVSTLLLPSEY
jgi:hypothetical protein